MKSIVQNTGTGVTVFAILALVLCMPGIAGSKSELPEIGLALTSTLTAPRHREDSRALSKTRQNALKSRKNRKKRLAAAMVYFWYAMARKNPS